ncbi:hypothetical protein K432DRAFT_378032 [Lepidopterella palustris CBS 459.81]|uniref:Small ribosomal subunit protein uS9m n=1 Tax=Lepidopterella palustris CBS 459.81 TaxID=1314670 RepID=A0A8E2EJB9_9PEZI|nr:hypothetical protein K432DRAFT_378032 [Lepidopterella palustris CBS 459.81]
MSQGELSRSLIRAIASIGSLSRPHARPRIRFPRRTLHPASFQCFSTGPIRKSELVSRSSGNSIAAPPIDFDEDAIDEQDEKQDEKAEKLLKTLRIVPASPSYFSAKPDFTDSLISLQALLRKYATLPVVPPGHAPRVAWKTVAQFRLVVNEPIKSAKYHRIIELLHRLNHIHPALMPAEVTQALDRYKRDINPHDNKAKPGVIDDVGRSKGVGRRKTSSAVAWLVEGEGEVLVNGKTLAQMFGRLHDRESAVWALKSTQRLDKYNVWALVKGGGVTGQAEALTLAVAKALLVHEPMLKPALRRAGCVTRDPRKVERKKAGHVKARKMPTWVKR